MPKLQPLKPIARRALSAQSDERLVRLVREGHDPAFEEIVRRYRGPLVGFATAIVSANGAEDVAQASLAKAHSALLDDSREINLRPWLFAIVRNGALNSVRGEPRVDELDEALAAHANPSDIVEQRDDFDRLVVAMCALPDAQRQALVKRELEGVGHGEIAAQLGTSATAVRGLIFRARTQLRDVMGALVPLPVLRALLAQGGTASAAGAAGGMAGGGASALIGGAGAKGGAVLAAAVLAVGSGIALEKRGRGHGDVEQAAAATRDGGGSGHANGSRVATTSTTASADFGRSSGSRTKNGADEPRSGESGDSGGSGGSDDSGRSGSGRSFGPGPSGSGSGSGAPGPSSGSGGNHGSGSQPPVSPPSGDDGSGHSGPGSGHEEGGDDELESPAPDEDSSGPGSDHETETEFPDDEGSSGPGSGDYEESDDHSG